MCVYVYVFVRVYMHTYVYAYVYVHSLDVMCCAFVFGSCSNATLRLYLHKLAARGSGSSPRLKASAQNPPKQTSRGSGAEL